MRRTVSVFLVIALLLLFSPTVAAAPRIIYKHAGASTQKRVALTFDDGPHPSYTAQILDILQEYGAKATFFAVGSNAKAYPELICRAVAQGHEIGSHTYHHYRVNRMDQALLREEILTTNRVLEEITGKRVQLFRPPEGVCTDTLKQICEKEGMTIVLWSVDTRDWAHTPIDEICCNIRENVRNGSIILMHDFIGKNSPTPNALRRIIPMLSELGYEFVTISTLLDEAE